MARKADHRVFNVAVVGFSGTEKDKGVEGIGKSCFCNRFMRPLADDYRIDHISVLSQSDFSGRVVNNDHFLYWGDRTITTDEGTDLQFHVVEQTEFIDDTSFQPFRSSPYYKRCAAVKLTSAEKLVYICKNQLGLEHEFEQKLLPEGKMTVDGFLCLFDVSTVHQRPFDRQLEYTSLILNNLQKTKKPVVLVTTKNDRSNEMFVREGEKLVSKYKGNIVLVETSAHDNVNVELAFITLAHLIDRTKGRPKVVPYPEAARTRKEILDVAREAYRYLVRSNVTDHRALWMPTLRALGNKTDYIHFVELFGTDTAKKIFHQHVRTLREEFIQRRVDMYLEKLKHLLEVILPDLTTIADRSWPSILRWVQRQEFFDEYFIMVPEGQAWWEPEFLESQEERIPFDLLERDEGAEECFRNHVNALRAEHKRAELRKQFKQLLEDNHNICPGKSLNEVAIFFLGRESFTSLLEEDKQSIYEQHQKELRERAKQEFQELLLEHADYFAKFDPHESVTADDLVEINERLQYEPRYKALSSLEEDRKVILLNHLGFVQCPSRSRCPERDSCVDPLLDHILTTKVHKPQSWSEPGQFQLNFDDVQLNQLNLVILGANGLADTFVHDLRLQCVEDEYVVDGKTYSLDYRPLDGDVTLPQNSFRTADFTPSGCFCIYNSPVTLEYLRDSLAQTVMCDASSREQQRLAFHGLPIVIVLAHDATATENGLMVLRREGQNLCDTLQCPFIDIPPRTLLEKSSSFVEAQVSHAMWSLMECIQHRAELLNPLQINESIEPDMRILLCMMCGDKFNLELPLTPLLNYQCCYTTSDDKYPTLMVETYLDGGKRKVEVTMVSYHSAIAVKDDLYHGHFLIYSAKRKASLVSLSALTSFIPPVPTRILAITDPVVSNVHLSNDYSHTWTTEGQMLAERLQASFEIVPRNVAPHIATYSNFFREAWSRKTETESAFSFSGDDDSGPMTEGSVERSLDHVVKRAPGSLLPKPPTRHESGLAPPKSASTSTEDSEPVYDQLHLDHCHSDGSDVADRTSSASPPPICDITNYSNMLGDEVLYSEIAPCDTEQLIKPSQVKSKRSLYAERYRRSFPSASTSSYGSSSVTSSLFREDSTDTDTSLRSPRPPQLDRIQHAEPHYQFRKSNSMKLALKEEHEGWSVNSTFDRLGKKLTKSSTLPPSMLPPGASGADSEFILAQAPPRPRSAWYDDTSTIPLLSQMENPAYDPGKKCSPPPTLPKPKPPTKPKPLDKSQFANVCSVLSHNISCSQGGGGVGAQSQFMKAPLATPEAIEIGSEYAQVKDALMLPENEYALVADALPAGKLHRIRSTFRTKSKQDSKGSSQAGSDSDSEFSSVERERGRDDIYTRVHRRPTPHKKKHKQGGPRLSDGSLAPPLPVYTEDRHFLVQQDLLLKDKGFAVRSNSPSEGSEGTGDENPPQRKPKKRRSFRNRTKKKQTESDSSLVISPPWSDSEQTSKTSIEDEGAYEPIGTRGEYAGNEEDAPDSGWMRKLRLKSEKDPDKLKKKEEKKAKEDERRKMKEEEKRLRAQKKKKKDGKPLLMITSQSSIGALEDMVQSDENLVPVFIEKCVTFIEQEGLHVEGIYRVPGNRAHVDLLMEKFKEDPNVDIYSLDIPVNAVATALKGFFNDLAQPLIPSTLYDELLETCEIRDRSSRFLALRGVLKKLPAVNFEVLRYLSTHIHVVTQHASQNSMDSKNLAICFWPTLLRPEFASFEKMTMASKLLEDIVVTIFEQYGFFFYGESEV